ncbi:hypothetical protein [Bdellovibrio svalbardensis]|uniref:Pentapeptide MXKDX repeat protein n=1 Tax=Bdellovibrio svalbardensis TaxID=2972972 RepID=A0ABT6DG31_9BACT|nr:hypothetical protein [Bdellovibrio svalbardensis]MDG0815758.1 hypothetical protein [Bdellovibrio svalbardensis]
MKFATVLMSLLFAGMMAHAQGEAPATTPAGGAEMSAPKAETSVKKDKKHKKHGKKEKSEKSEKTEGMTK